MTSIRTTAAAVGALMLTAAIAVPAAPSAQEARMPAPIVYFDIAGPELAGQAKFYNTVFGWEVGPSGAVSVPVASPLLGNLRVEAPGPEPLMERVIYLGVDDVTAALAKVVANGGGVVFPRLVVPGVAIVGLFKDPAGNRMGLVEMEGGKAKVPPAK